MNKDDSIARLHQIMNVLDLRSEASSPFQTTYRLDPFIYLSNSGLYSNCSIGEVVRRILNRRFAFLDIYKFLKTNGLRNEIIEPREYSEDILEAFETSEPYNLPLKLPIRARVAYQNGVPPGDRVEDELFFTLIRILELFLSMSGGNWKAFDRLLNQQNVQLAIESIDKKDLLQMLMQANPNIVSNFFPNLNMSALSDDDYNSIKETECVKNWKSILMRTMITIYIEDRDLLKLVNPKLREIFITHGLPTKSEKTIDPVLTEYRKILNVSQSFSV